MWDISLSSPTNRSRGRCLFFQIPSGLADWLSRQGYKEGYPSGVAEQTAEGAYQCVRLDARSENYMLDLWRRISL